MASAKRYAGKNMISFWVPSEMHKSIKKMCIDKDMTIQRFFEFLAEKVLLEHGGK